MAPGNTAVVANVVEAADLGRVRTSRHVDIGHIDRHAIRAPRVDVAAQVAGLPAPSKVMDATGLQVERPDRFSKILVRATASYFASKVVSEICQVC